MARKKNATRADGRIAVQVYLGRDENGKRKYKTVYGKTQAEANKKAEEIKAKLGKGIDVQASERDTFKDWYKKWVVIKSTKVGESQMQRYAEAFLHLGAEFVNTPIAKLRPADLELVLTLLAKCNQNTKKPASQRLLDYVKQVATQVCDYARKNRVIDANLMRDAEVPEGTVTKREALTDEQQKWVYETPHRAQTAAMIMMYAGLRRGELIPLMWSDVDLDNATITVNKAVKIVDGKYVVKNHTKTEAGMRVVDIPQRLVDFLNAQPKEGFFVVTSTKGQMHTVTSWRRMWNTYMLDLNIKYGDFSAYENKPKSKYDPRSVPIVIKTFDPHELRHTFATMLYLAGVDVMTAKEQLGHKNIQTTLDIYTHLDRKFRRRSMAKLDDFLDGASQMQVKKTEEV